MFFTIVSSVQLLSRKFRSEVYHELLLVTKPPFCHLCFSVVEYKVNYFNREREGKSKGIREIYVIH